MSRRQRAMRRRGAKAVDGPTAPSRPLNIRHGALGAMLDRARTCSPAEAAQAEDGTVVQVRGKARPGPAGPLRAPLSGMECVWHRSFVLRAVDASMTRGGMTPTPFHGLASSDGPWQRMVKASLNHPSLGSDRTSSAPFTIGDGHHAIAVDPRTTDVMSELTSINDVVESADRDQRARAGLRRLSGWTGFSGQELHTEWIIPVGTELVGLGIVRRAPDGTATLSTVGDEIAVASTMGIDRVVSRVRGRDQGRRMGRVMIAALVVLGLAIAAFMLRSWF